MSRVVQAAARMALAVLGMALAGAAAAGEVIDDRGRRFDFVQPAARIVSLLPSLSESVCALDGCGRLVGVDRFSNFPAALQPLPHVGGLEDAQIERIVALKPGVVLAAASSRAVDRLEGLGLRVVVLEPRTHADTRRALAAVAVIVGRPGAGDALWAQIDARIDAAAAQVPASLRGRRVYFEVGSGPYAAGEASFVGETLRRLGLANVVPAALGPFPKLNPEFVLRARPELAMGPKAMLDELPRRPGWAALPMVAARRGCGFGPADYDMLVRPGPRLGEGAERIVACLQGLAKAAP